MRPPTPRRRCWQVHGHTANVSLAVLEVHSPGADGLAVLHGDGVGGYGVVLVQLYLGGTDCSSTKTRKRIANRRFHVFFGFYQFDCDVAHVVIHGAVTSTVIAGSVPPPP